jgi:GAF domain-containing protein
MAMAAKVPSPGSGADKRRNRRKNIIGSQLLTVDVALGRTAAERQWQRGIVIDLSESGMAIQPFLPLTPGTVGDVRIELPGDPKPVTSAGMVAWVGQGGRAGIRFIDVPASAREQLREWLSRNPRGVAPHDELFVLEAPASEAPSIVDSRAESIALAAGAAVVAPEAEQEQEYLDSRQEEIESEEVDFQAALQLIAERAQLITSASGAAVAIGDNDGMVCRASAGTAPDMGAQLRPDSGLSGYCLRSGELVHCADTQTDPRIDAAAARQLDLGSIIIVPVFVAGRLAGVLEVLSSRPNAFDDRQVIRLERFAELLGATVEEHQRSQASEAEESQAAAEDDALKFTAATVPEAIPAISGKSEAATLPEEAATPAAPPSPSFVFDAALSALPGMAPQKEPAAKPETVSAPKASKPEPMQEDLVTHVMAVTDNLSAPAKTAGPIFLATPAEWAACGICGHQNPPWAQLCENCHADPKASSKAEKLAEPPLQGASDGNDTKTAQATGRLHGKDTGAPQFRFSPRPSGIRWSRWALAAVIVILVVLAGLAGVYLGRRARLEQAPMPNSGPPAAATVTAPAPALDVPPAVQPAPQPAPQLEAPAPKATEKAVEPAKPAAPKHAAKQVPRTLAPQLSAAERKTMWPEKSAGGK